MFTLGTHDKLCLIMSFYQWAADTTQTGQAIVFAQLNWIA